MSQDYYWINRSKKEYIQGLEFDCGTGLYGSRFVGCEELETVYTLLASDWKDDTIVFLSDGYVWNDEYSKKEKYIKLHDLLECDILPVDDDDLYYVYKNKAVYFKKCKEEMLNNFEEDLNNEILRISGSYTKLDNQDLEDIPKISKEKYNEILNKFFLRESTYYRYVINHSKKEYIDRDLLPKYGKYGSKHDPFPILMAVTRNWQNEPYEDDAIGLWILDKIEVTNCPPSSEYKEMGETYEYLITKMAPYKEDE